MLRFGSQIDTQPLNDIDDTGKAGLARRVAAYFASAPPSRSPNSASPPAVSVRLS